MTRLHAFCSAAALAAALAFQAPAAFAGQPTFAADLAAAHSDAVALRTSADNLAMLARTPMKYSAEAHATELARADRLAERITRRVDRMNAQRSGASAEQLARLDALTRWSGEATQSVNQAIRAFNGRNGVAGLYQTEYQTPVSDLYEDARALASPSRAAGAASAD